MDQVTISIKEAGCALGLSRSAIYILINEDRLETVKVGRRRLVKTSSIRRLIGEHSQAAQ